MEESWRSFCMLFTLVAKIASMDFGLRFGGRGGGVQRFLDRGWFLGVHKLAKGKML